MAGILTLHLSILQTPISTLIPTLPTQPPTKHQLLPLIPEPLRITYAWTWISFALNETTVALPPIATLLTTWIEVVGPEARRLWGEKQVGKLMELIQREAAPGGRIKGDGEPARVRLELVVGGWRSAEYIQGREWE
jgi:nucleoporin GLE1